MDKLKITLLKDDEIVGYINGTLQISLSREKEKIETEIVLNGRMYLNFHSDDLIFLDINIKNDKINRTFKDMWFDPIRTYYYTKNCYIYENVIFKGLEK